MNKQIRKKLELELILATEEILSGQHPKAAEKIRKVLKQHARQIAKKFAKEAKGLDKKTSKTKTVSRPKPVKTKGPRLMRNKK